MKIFIYLNCVAKDFCTDSKALFGCQKTEFKFVTVTISAVQARLNTRPTLARQLTEFESDTNNNNILEIT